MLNLKANVYNHEWLEVVFANRNKLYGVYELRYNYSKRLTKALLFTIIPLGIAVTVLSISNEKTDDLSYPTISRAQDDSKKIIDVSLLPKDIKTPAVKKSAPANALEEPKVSVSTKRFTAFTVVPQQHAIEDIPVIDNIKNDVIASVNQTGDLPQTSNVLENSGVEGKGPDNGTGNEIHNMALLEKYPTFPGGEEAFFKFLSRNLRYPEVASENGIQGKVIVSFVVEKTGELTDIKIIKGLSPECDEEAMRVLKKAPKWQPGEQNGQKVRVLYTIPIAFKINQ